MNREAWLKRAAKLLTPMLEAAGTVPPLNIRYSCGWPSVRKGGVRIGECWTSTASKDGHFEIFISPSIDEPIRVLDILLHEMIHAAVGLDCGHKGEFKRVAKAVGLEGKMTATIAGENLKQQLIEICRGLGDYPHAELVEGQRSGPKKQKARLLKVVCPDCEYAVRTTHKWIEVGLPTCCCGTSMMEDISNADGCVQAKAGSKNWKLHLNNKSIG